jgi:hypothetical protein
MTFSAVVCFQCILAKLEFGSFFFPKPTFEVNFEMSQISDRFLLYFQNIPGLGYIFPSAAPQGIYMYIISRECHIIYPIFQSPKNDKNMDEENRNNYPSLNQ